jgi:hypothetical protein
MSKIITALFLAAAIAGGVFLATHHAVYGPCKPHQIECERTLIKYVGNK